MSIVIVGVLVAAMVAVVIMAGLVVRRDLTGPQPVRPTYNSRHPSP
ncbi:hypothetical protein [Jiangella gansuensis]|nr:hypothetical protein [Jiangella gansuensis]